MAWKPPLTRIPNRRLRHLRSRRSHRLFPKNDDILPHLQWDVADGRALGSPDEPDKGVPTFGMMRDAYLLGILGFSEHVLIELLKHDIRRVLYDAVDLQTAAGVVILLAQWQWADSLVDGHPTAMKFTVPPTTQSPRPHKDADQLLLGHADPEPFDTLYYRPD